MDPADGDVPSTSLVGHHGKKLHPWEYTWAELVCWPGPLHAGPRLMATSDGELARRPRSFDTGFHPLQITVPSHLTARGWSPAPGRPPPHLLQLV